MKWLSILYDDRCGVCSRLRRWLERQPVYLPLQFVPLHSPDLARRYPGVGAFHPDEKLVVISDGGEVWRCDSAWITLLWALKDGRVMSQKLASPMLRPLARRVVDAVSSNRLRLSQWLGFKPDAIEASACSDGSCNIPASKFGN